MAPNVLRRLLMDWFGLLKPNLYATHNFGYSVSAETGQRSLTRFYNRMQSRVHGRNRNKRNTNQTMVAVGVWEHVDTNPHCHVFVAASEKEGSWLLEEGNDSWLWLQPRGQCDIGEIESLAEGDFVHHENMSHTRFSRSAVRLQSATFEVAYLKFAARWQQWTTYGTFCRKSS